MFSNAIILIQFIFSIIIGIYFLNLLKSQQGNKSAIEKESRKEIEKLRKLRAIKLTEPLSEKTRPSKLEEVIGQEKGLRALKAALCSPNPQHVIIYGMPGIGKTAAARVVLEEAKKIPISPFTESAKFIEIDATTLRFDERSIADPLIGSVHDPIYQGAGAYGQAGIPQPKYGAVTKAHGGVLFIDEIGELHPIQLNKLLKVLEDRKVFLESSYYSSEDTNIPRHIHEVFEKGLPADFRLIGATTRTPEELPPALRSRCLEIFFKPLSINEIAKISINACKKTDFIMDEGLESLIAKYANNGREAVNIIQIACGIALIENRKQIKREDIEWVIEFGRYNPRIEKKVLDEKQVGCINGLAVSGKSQGMIIDIEVSAVKNLKSEGKIIVTGIIEEEEMDNKGQKFKRRSSARASIENMLTVIKNFLQVNISNYNIHINFPGGIPIDGPSAGVAIMTAVYSAIMNIPLDGTLAMTGEISIKGKVKPVGGVVAKVEAAKEAGIKKVLIPKDNWQELFESMDIEVVGIEDVDQLMKIVFDKSNRKEIVSNFQPDTKLNILTASRIN